ncbi:MAG: response regulator [Lachnospiraceae bacterium]|nr:response regulator [Lachnospiraceae bacterium]
MYKVVIIDDEPIIVTGLTKLVPWEKYDCQVAGTASDGQEGLELIRKVRPDMVFSDIYMPRMDGLLMAAALKSEYEDMEITILTGYRDFELVQQALRLGICRFILKPSSMEELEEALAAMTEKLKKKGILPERQRDILPFGEEEQRSILPDREEGQRGILPSNKEEQASRPESEAEEKTQTESESQAGSFIVKNALAYMRSNYRSRLTLKDVADNTYVSQWHLSKLLNRHTEQSFSELLNSIRVEEAKRLLENPALRIGDVAEEVGFLDLAHFSRVFKKVTGISANEYRNRLK